jgi:hypothetical protein
VEGEEHEQFVRMRTERGQQGTSEHRACGFELIYAAVIRTYRSSEYGMS